MCFYDHFCHLMERSHFQESQNLTRLAMSHAFLHLSSCLGSCRHIFCGSSLHSLMRKKIGITLFNAKFFWKLVWSDHSQSQHINKYLHILIPGVPSQTAFHHNSHRMLVNHMNAQQACEVGSLSRHGVLALYEKYKSVYLYSISIPHTS